jgi:hypothetical protein
LISVTVSSDAPSPFATPITASLTFEDLTETQMWAPWDRLSYQRGPSDTNWTDPLMPSEAAGWWGGRYRYGTQYSYGKDADAVVAPLASALRYTPAKGADAGVTLMLDPNEAQEELELRTSSAGELAFTRDGFRYVPGKRYVFAADLVGHAGCWRAALAWTVREHAALWNPTTESVRDLEGLGSYSWSTADVDVQRFKALGYRLNWDLSGKFFPVRNRRSNSRPWYPRRCSAHVPASILRLGSTWGSFCRRSVRPTNGATTARARSASCATSPSALSTTTIAGCRRRALVRSATSTYSSLAPT